MQLWMQNRKQSGGLPRKSHNMSMYNPSSLPTGLKRNTTLKRNNTRKHSDTIGEDLNQKINTNKNFKTKSTCDQISNLILRQRISDYYRQNPLGPAGRVRGVVWLHKCPEVQDAFDLNKPTKVTNTCTDVRRNAEVTKKMPYQSTGRGYSQMANRELQAQGSSVKFQRYRNFPSTKSDETRPSTIRYISQSQEPEGEGEEDLSQMTLSHVTLGEQHLDDAFTQESPSKKVGFIEPKMSLRSKTLYEKDFRSAEIDEKDFCETSSDPGSRKKTGKSSRHKTLALPGNSTTTDDTDDQDFTKSQKLQQIGKTLTYQESGDRSLAKNGLYLNSDLHKPYEDFQEAEFSTTLDETRRSATNGDLGYSSELANLAMKSKTVAELPKYGNKPGRICLYDRDQSNADDQKEYYLVANNSIEITDVVLE